MLIDAEKANCPVRWMCQVLNVPRSSFYDWHTRSRNVTATAQRRSALGRLVEAVFDEFRQIYGCRRITRELNDRGHACSVGLIADLMREQGLVAVQPRRYRVTTITDAGDVYPPDLLERDFAAELPGTRLVGDITYLRTDEGWAYLAVVIDLATRMVVGRQIADHMRTSLVIDALQMARDHSHLTPGAIFHTDRGTQGGFNWSSHTSMMEVVVFKHQQVAAVREMRGKMWSPGRPSTFRREHRVRFWEAIGRGLSTEDAAAEVGMSAAVGRGGSAKLAACRLSSWSRYRALTCRLLSVRRSPSSMTGVLGWVRSAAGWAVTRRQSVESYAGAPQPVATSCRIGPRQRNGTPSGVGPSQGVQAGHRRPAAGIRSGPAVGNHRPTERRTG